MIKSTVLLILISWMNVILVFDVIGQSRFETAPYEVRIVLTTDQSAVWTDEILEKFREQLPDSLSMSFGSLLNADVETARDLIPQHDLNHLTKSLVSNLLKQSEKYEVRRLDKVIYVQLQHDRGRFYICAVEHDLTNQYVGTPAIFVCHTMDQVERNIVKVIAGAFGGTARIVGTKEGKILLRSRGSLVPTRDTALTVCSVGAVYELLTKGQQTLAGIESDEKKTSVWRYLVVEESDPLAAPCRLVSRFGENLSEIPADSFVARQINPIHNSTTIQFFNSETGLPLVGLAIELIDHVGRTIQHARSDLAGRLIVSRLATQNDESSQLVELIVRCHQQQVLRFPIVVGWKQEQRCELALGEKRLEGLALIQSHRHSLNDWITYREVVSARASALKTSDQATASQLLATLKAEAAKRKSAMESKARADLQRFTLDKHHWNQLMKDIVRETEMK